MICVNSFTGTGDYAIGRGVKIATDKANSWIEELNGDWREVNVTAMSTQCIAEENTYIITLVVNCNDVILEGEI